MRKKDLVIVDLFCGAGGASAGVISAVKEKDLAYHMTAINHNPKAIRTHMLTHPEVHHLCTGVEAVDPPSVVKGGKVDLLWASPSCVGHSVAAGGKPRSDQQRAQPWLVLHWLETLYVKRLLMENVKEIVQWGPLGSNGLPLKSKKGMLFQQMLDHLTKLGYRYEWRILNCADYGDVTTRKRFFLQAVRGKGEIRWPEPTHFQYPKKGQKKWRAAREIIDWSIEGTSVFNRERPLSPNTMKRIAAGIKKFWGPWAKPFLVLLNSTNPRGIEKSVIDIDAPFPTITTSNHLGMVELKPFSAQLSHGLGKEKDPHSRRVDDLSGPMRTVTTKGDQALIVGKSFVLSQHSEGAPRSVEDPLSTITTDGASQKLDSFIIATGGPQGARNSVKSVDDILGTICATDRKAIVQAFIDTANNWESQQSGRSIDKPLPTQTTSNHLGLVEAELTPALMVQYNGNGKSKPVSEPLFTVTCRDRAGLLWRVGLDIRFRMFQPHELALAHSMDLHKFEGTKTDTVAQIGNSVPVKTAKALSLAVLQDMEDKWKGRKTKKKQKPKDSQDLAA